MQTTEVVRWGQTRCALETLAYIADDDPVAAGASFKSLFHAVVKAIYLNSAMPHRDGWSVAPSAFAFGQ